jgi:hypothetical protein
MDDVRRTSGARLIRHPRQLVLCCQYGWLLGARRSNERFTDEQRLHSESSERRNDNLPELDL